MSKRLNNKCSFFLLALCALFLVIPRPQEILWFVYLVIVLALMYQGGVIWGRLRPLRPAVTTSLAFLSIVLVAVMARYIGGLGALINLFFIAYGLKFLEQRSSRDIRVLILLGFFGCGVNFVFSQTIPFTFYLFFCLILSCAGAIAFEIGDVGLRQPMKNATFLVLCSLPITVLLFIVVPRIDPLWTLPDSKRATSGLSDHVSPGGIAKLSRDSSLAFRAVFNSPFPPSQEMYWRAMTQEVFDGVSWSIHPRMKFFWQKQRALQKNLVEKRGTPLSYELYIEPNGQRWLFTLDFSEVSGADVRMLPDTSWRAKSPVVRKRQVNATAWQQTIIEPEISTEIRKINLLLPDVGNEKSRAMGEQLKEDYPEPEKRVAAVLTYLKSNSFVYTLEPPLLFADQVDMFLFKTRAGFCGHYASSFTYLMRAAGVPARLVTGYLGGELHPSGSHYSIYQFDAHAWAEVWFDDRGWVRVDPTVVVAPERAIDLENALPEEFRSLASLAMVRYRGVAWLNEIRNGWMLLDYHWTRWVISFDNSRQTNVLQHILGAITFLRLSLFIFGMVVVALLLILMFFKWNQWRDSSKESRLFETACRKMGRVGWPKDDTETPFSYSERLLLEESTKATKMSHICEMYQQLHYQDLPGDDRKTLLRELRRAVRKL